MKYFFPDSQDFVDPEFDFITEKRDPLRVRQRDDAYAHQMLNTRPYDGLLISKAMVEGVPGKTSKTRYSEGQKYRLYREGAHRYFRLGKRFEVMGDSGASLPDRLRCAEQVAHSLPTLKRMKEFIQMYGGTHHHLYGSNYQN